MSETNRRGESFQYTYDSLDRLVQTSFPDGSRRTYTYDAIGNLLSVEDAHSKLSFTYDFDLLLSVSTKGSPFQPEARLSYEYDNNDNRISLRDSLSGRRPLLYYYNRENDLTQVRRSFRKRFLTQKDPTAVDFFYDKERRLTEIIYPNGVKSAFEYAPGKRGRLREIKHTRGGKDLSSFAYEYNLNDHVTSLKTMRSGITVNATQSYAYDVSNQLTSATRAQGTGSETFTYDILGNRLRKDSESVDSTFNDNNQLVNDKSFSYTYDENGNEVTRTNLSTGEITEKAWDYEDRLIQVVKRPSAGASPTSTVRHRYDAFDRKIETNRNGKIIRTLFDGSNRYLEFEGEDNTLTARYIYGGNRPLLVERENTPYRNATYARQDLYYHTDRLGSVTEITNFVGEVVQRYTYTAYGEKKVYDKNGTLTTHKNAETYLPNPITWTGQECEPETGLCLHGVRWYDPFTGRWQSEDPARLEGGDANFYTYVKNDPMNYIDPNGLIRIPWFKKTSIFDEAENHPLGQGVHGTLGNAFKHCFASCLYSLEASALVSFSGGVAFELVNYFSSRSEDPFKEGREDLGHNLIGLRLASERCPSETAKTFFGSIGKAGDKTSKYCEEACLKAQGEFTIYPEHQKKK